MELSISKQELMLYTSSQMNYFFPDKNLIDLSVYSNAIDTVLDRVNFCFQPMIFEKYKKNGKTLFNHLYSDQYLLYLWFLSNTFWREDTNLGIASKAYYLNKALHSFDCMYDTALPDIFFISHGIGTMLGKASYSDYFIAMQGCTVGANNGIYPRLGKGVSLTAHSSVIGDCVIGDSVTISSYTNIFQKNIPADSLVFRGNESGAIEIRSSSRPFISKVFDMKLYRNSK